VDKAPTTHHSGARFEKFCEGRLLNEYARHHTRICGIFLSVIISGTKACDRHSRRRADTTAQMLRRLLHYSQYVNLRRCTSSIWPVRTCFFGWNPPGGAEYHRRHRRSAGTSAERRASSSFGQKIIEYLAKKEPSPNAAIPRGMNKALSESEAS